MAPFSAGMPQLIPLPSNAGPPAAEVIHKVFESHNAISELVPKSTNKLFCFPCIKLVEIIPASKSDPTKPERDGIICSSTFSDNPQSVFHCLACEKEMFTYRCQFS